MRAIDPSRWLAPHRVENDVAKVQSAAVMGSNIINVQLRSPVYEDARRHARRVIGAN